ncbi:MAG TPA: AMP-binding protein, partial [Draconibacterium sp.]|nr:AMP-binding protein [Draconibacterium sp.]
MEKSSLTKLYNQSFQNNWEKTAFTDYEGKDFKYSEVAQTIMSLQLFYQIMGLQKGDKVAVLGRNSANWGATFLSAVSSGLVIVPVLPDFNKNDTNHIINHSESKIVIGAKSLLDKVELEALPNVLAILVVEDFSLYKAKDENIQYKIKDSFKYYEQNPLKKTGFAFNEWEPEQACIISYTSGTSGFTKGVMIPERSLVSNIVYAREHMPLKSGNKIVSFLPMAHVYGLLFEFLFPLSVGCHITFLSKMP